MFLLASEKRRSTASPGGLALPVLEEFLFGNPPLLGWVLFSLRAAGQVPAVPLVRNNFLEPELGQCWTQPQAASQAGHAAPRELVHVTFPPQHKTKTGVTLVHL